MQELRGLWSRYNLCGCSRLEGNIVDRKKGQLLFVKGIEY